MSFLESGSNRTIIKAGNVLIRNRIQYIRRNKMSLKNDITYKYKFFKILTKISQGISTKYIINNKSLKTAHPQTKFNIHRKTYSEIIAEKKTQNTTCTHR